MDKGTAYEKGWKASSRTTTFDLDAAEDRFVARYGPAETRHQRFSTYVDAFIAGWTDHAADNEYGTALLTERDHEMRRMR